MARPLPSPALLAASSFRGLDQRAGFLVVLDDAQDVAGGGDFAEAQDDHGRRRPGLLDALAQVVLEGSHATGRLADDDDVADVERAGLDQRGRDRAAVLVQLRLDDRADGAALRVGLELLQVRDEQDHLDQLVEADAGLRRDRHERHVAAVLLDDDAGFGQLGLDPVRVGVRLVDLVHRDDDRDLGRLRVADRLEGLGHDAVVRRDDDHGDVRDLRAAGTHGGERLVARRIEEDDALAVVGDFARTDVLGDPATLARRDFSGPDRVQEARLAVVDVTHDGHDRGTRLQERRIVLFEQDFLGRLGDRAFAFAFDPAGAGRDRLGDFEAEFTGDQRRGVAVDELVDGREDAALDQLADDVGRVDRQDLGELLDGDRAGQLDRATLTRVGDLDLSGGECAVATRRLARAATAAGAAPTPGHGLLLGWSCQWGCPPAARRASWREGMS